MAASGIAEHNEARRKEMCLQKQAFKKKTMMVNTSENVVCLCRLLNILANFSNLFFAYRQTVWTQIILLLKEQSDLGPHCLQKCILKSQAEDKADDNCCDWRFKVSLEIFGHSFDSWTKSVNPDQIAEQGLHYLPFSQQMFWQWLPPGEMGKYCWTRCSRETHKRVLGKQCRPRSDAAERGIWSGLHCLQIV